MRLLMTALIGMAMAISVSANASTITPLEFFDFETDAAGTAFGPNWVNSGTLDNDWNFGGPGTIAANGSGQLVISGHNGQTFRKLPKKGTGNAAAAADQYATPFTTGVYLFELTYESWSLDPTAAQENAVDLQLRPTQSSGSLAGIRMKLSDDSGSNMARVQMFFDSTDGGNQNGFRSFDLPLTGTGPESFAIELDYDNGTVNYFHNGVNTDSFANLNTSTALGTVQFSTSGTWDPDNTVSIEELGLSQVTVEIPEPSSAFIAMILAGVAGVSSRRR